MNSAMPYVVVGESALQLMKNADGESLYEIPLEKLLLETMEVNGEDSLTSSIQVRICGFFQEKDKVPFPEDRIYMTDEQIIKIMDQLKQRSVEDRYGNNAVNQYSETNEHMLKYVIILKNGFKLKSIITALETTGFNISDKTIFTQLFMEWEKIEFDIWQKIFMLWISFACAGLLIYYQGKLWLMENRYFVDYLKTANSKLITVNKIYRYRIYLYDGIGCGGGLCFFLIHELFYL